jgi:hypothetical protein
VRRAAFMIVASLFVAACSRTYHPDYHPETSYTYAQNVTYVKNGIFAPRGAPEEAPSAPDASAGEATPHGRLTSSGAVVIYGDFTGNVYVGR